MNEDNDTWYYPSVNFVAHKNNVCLTVVVIDSQFNGILSLVESIITDGHQVAICKISQSNIITDGHQVAICKISQSNNSLTFASYI